MNNEPEKRRCDYCRIAEAEVEDIREERDKWKEAALAIREAALYARGIVLTKRVESAFEALGDDWGEAVK